MTNIFTGWVDDSVFVRRNPEANEEVWSNGGGHAGHQASGAFTTGRSRGRPNPLPPAVKPRSQVGLIQNYDLKALQRKPKD